jgi:precorrin-3B methylase
MADLNTKSREYIIKKHEYSKLIALSLIQAKEIRMIELQEEIERCKTEIDAQNVLIKESEKNINEQKELLKQEKQVK